MSGTHIFIILLLIFIVTIVYGNRYTHGYESFITYNESMNPLSNIIVPPYSTTKPLLKIYDNMYLDQTNYNLIEVNGSPYNQGDAVVSNTQTTPSFANLFVVKPYDKSSTTASIDPTNTTDFALSQLQMPVLNGQWSYISQTPETVTDKLQLFFVPYTSLNMVILYVVNLTKSKSLMSLILQQSSIQDSYFVGDAPFTNLSPAIADNDSNNGTLVIEPFYDPATKVYQLSKLVKFDFGTMNCIVKNTADAGSPITIYDASKNSKGSSVNATAGQYTQSGLITNNFSPWTLVDANNNLVVYLQMGNGHVMICMLQKNTTSQNAYNLTLGQSFVFQQGVGLKSLNGSVITPAATPQVTTAPNPTISGQATTLTSAPFGQTPSAQIQTPTIGGKTSDYYSTLFNRPYSQDYVLKTQLIPPVSCPNCICGNSNVSSSGNCSSCASCGGGGIITPTSTTTPAPQTTAIMSITPTQTNVPTTASPSTATTKHPGTATTHPGTATTHPGTATTHPGTATTHPGTATTHPGTATTHPKTTTKPPLSTSTSRSTPHTKHPAPTITPIGFPTLPLGQYPGMPSIPGVDLPNIPVSGGGGLGNLLSGYFGSGVPTFTSYGNTDPSQSPSIDYTGGGVNIPNPIIAQSGRAMNKPNQRNQYYGTPEIQSSVINQWGAQNDQRAAYLPITSDFSRFSR